MTEAGVWAIFFLPLIAFLLIAFVTIGSARLSGWLAVVAISVSFLLSVGTLFGVAGEVGHVLHFTAIPWLVVGDLVISIGLNVDSLTAVMLVVVTAVSLLVQIYSHGYMAGDPGFARYFSYLSLFTASMLGLLLADNVIMLFVFWELVGLCSYLLVGFWYQKPSAAAAAKKAFITTRVGDLGFLIAILVIGMIVGGFSYQEIFAQQSVEKLEHTAFLGISALTWVCLGLFSGAIGKSAQFPLHVWLPDAMEGPTPVSALIHAATMVAAGVYLVARLFPMFHHSPEAMMTVAVIGGITAILAASMGLVANDIKRVMAYSTVSQLGYMMLALGVGAYPAAIFHLYNHAFFKALLFLGSGSVNHTTGTFNMQYMGGLRRAMPWTFGTLLVGSLSLAGIPPFSGFWSKDEILAASAGPTGHPVLFAVALVAAFMTAFYVFRMMFLTFFGEYRGGLTAEIHETGVIPVPAYAAGGAHGTHSTDAARETQGAAAAPYSVLSPQSSRPGESPPETVLSAGHHLHESPWIMVGPMAVLAVPSAVSWIVNPPFTMGFPAHWFSDFLFNENYRALLGEHNPEPLNPAVAGASVVFAAAGIVLAYLMYITGSVSPKSVGSILGGMPYRVLVNKWGFDYLYEDILVRGVLFRLAAGFAAAFDSQVVDGVVNGAGQLARSAGNSVRLLQNGQLQSYGLAIFMGVVVIMTVVMARG